MADETIMIGLVGKDAVVHNAFEIFEKNFNKEHNSDHCPIIGASTENDYKLFNEYGEMVERHQRKYPGKTIIFYDATSKNEAAPPQSLVTQRFNGYGYQPLIPIPIAAHSYQEVCSRAFEKPSDYNLAQVIIQRVKLKRVGARIYRYNGIYYHCLSDNDLKTLIVHYLQDYSQHRGDAKMISAVAGYIEADPSIQAVKPEDYRHLVCLENGIFNINTGELLPHTPEYFLTWKLCASWDPNATCPLFLNYLSTVCNGSQELGQRFLQVLGYLLLAPGNQWKHFVILKGMTNSGKSVFCNVIRNFFEASAVAAVNLRNFGDRFTMASLVEARVNIVGELSAKELTFDAVSRLKEITGGDEVPIERKYHQEYYASIPCKLVFATNFSIKTEGYDSAFQNRMLTLPFLVSVPRSQQDPYLDEKLISEKSGILRLAYVAYLSYLKHGRQFAGEDLCCSIQDYCAPSITREDVVNQFISSCLVEDPTTFTTTSEIYESFQKNMSAICFEPFANVSAFSKCLNTCMKAKGLPAKTGQRRVGNAITRGYVGIKLVC